MTLRGDFLAPRRRHRIQSERPSSRLWPLLLLFAAGISFILAGSLRASTSSAAPSPAPASAWQGAYAVPSRATNGELLVVVPHGTREVMDAGGDGYLMPSVINLTVGDRIVIRNDDIAPHIVMFAFVLPGETVERVLDRPLSETYSAGCTITPSPIGFTSLFVRDR